MGDARVVSAPTPIAPAESTPGRGRLRLALEMIRFSHSLFALPFALLALVLAADGIPPLRTLGLVVVAMVAARSAAMAFNRLADRRFDATNPRTANRHLVTGSLSVPFAWGLTMVCVGIFFAAAALLNPTALLLSPAVLAVLLGYSYLKRFTSAAHFGVGLALGLSPLGAWVAGAGGLVGDLRLPILLGVAVVLWVAGFDVIYACQDVDVDRREGLHSIPARFGVPVALRIAGGLHFFSVAAFVLVGPLAGLHWPYYAAAGLATSLLLYEHSIVSPTDLSKVNVAFFNVNGFVALLLGAVGIADILIF
jgi:4-hydroxybenzoate polyprenyltransferase